MGDAQGKAFVSLISTPTAFCTWHFHSPGIFCSAWATRCPRFSTHQTKKIATKDAPEPSPGLRGCDAHGQPPVPRARLHRSPGTHGYRGKSSSPSQIQAGKPPVFFLPLHGTGFLPETEILTVLPKAKPRLDASKMPTLPGSSAGERGWSLETNPFTPGNPHPRCDAVLISSSPNAQ